MPQGRENVYTCTSCKRQLVTIDRDQGTTPFFMRCDPKRTPGGCGGKMESACYPTGERPPHIDAPTHEWYNPTPAELAVECEKEDAFHAKWLREHVAMGGLLIRPIAADRSDAIDAPLTELQRLHVHEQRMKTYEAVKADWEKNGKVGAPPPRPVKPHTPGALYVEEAKHGS
jgi:hypothetical protein